MLFIDLIDVITSKIVYMFFLEPRNISQANKKLESNLVFSCRLPQINENNFTFWILKNNSMDDYMLKLYRFWTDIQPEINRKKAVDQGGMGMGSG